MMLYRCRLQTKNNKFFVEMPLKKVKDITYRSDKRATFDFNFERNSFDDVPSAVIKKDRIDDINIKSGS